jgi:hypothetical protein
MNIKSNLAARFAPEMAFKPDPLKGKVGNAANLENLKADLLARSVAQAANESEKNFYLRAAREASNLANLTGYPSLVFPVLFEEKLRDRPRVVVSSTETRTSPCEITRV